MSAAADTRSEPGVLERALRAFFLNRRWITLGVVIIVWQILTWVIDIDLFPTPLGVVDSIGDAWKVGCFSTIWATA